MSEQEWLDKNGQGQPRHLLTERFASRFGLPLREAAVKVTRWMTYMEDRT